MFEEVILGTSSKTIVNTVVAQVRSFLPVEYLI